MNWKVASCLNYCMESLQEAFESLEFEALNITEKLQLVLKHLAPYRVCRPREESGQIVNTRIEEWKKIRHRLFKLYKDSNVKQWLHKSHQLSRRIRRNWLKVTNEAVQIKVTSANLKSFWPMLEKLLGRTTAPSE